MAINPFPEPGKNSLGADLSADVVDEMEIDLEEGEEGVFEEEATDDTDPYLPGGFYEDLTYLFTDEELKKIGSRICANVEQDDSSREVWRRNAVMGLKLLGLDLSDTSGAIMKGACHATHPLILETAVKFQSKASTELLPANGPADSRIIGKKTQEKMERANRVKQHLNFQLTEVMPEFYPESEKCYLYTAIFGDGFKKAYRDPDKERNASQFVPANLLIVPNNTSSLEDAERYTEVMPLTERTLRNRMNSGFYREMEIAVSNNDIEDPDNEDKDTVGSGNILTPSIIELDELSTTFAEVMGVQAGPSGEGFVLYEHYCYHNFKGKSELKDLLNRKLPYIITVDSESQNVLSIRRGWNEEDVLKKQRSEYYVQYSYIPSFMGFYSFGLIHLLGNFQMVMTSMLRSLVDAGQFANLQGGYKIKGPRLTGPTEEFQMGEYRDLEIPMDKDIRQVLMPHQFKEPSQVVQALLQWLDGRGGEFAASTEQVVSGSANYGPVGTTMALLEAAGKMYAAIYKRFHKAQGRELKIFARLNFEFMGDEEEYPFEVNKTKGDVEEDDKGIIAKDDYDPKQVDVIPVSDPNVSSQAHRVAIANAKLDALTKAKGVAPELAIDFPKVIKEFILQLDPQDDVSELIKSETKAKPGDPLTDVRAMVNGDPVSAFPGQNHQAHIAFMNAWLENPDQGGSKMFQQFQPQAVSYIRSHAIMQLQASLDVPETGVANDPQTKAQMQAEAAQALAKAAQQAKTANTPEDKVANAVLMEAQTKEKKFQSEEKSKKYDQLLDLVEKVIGLTREENRAAEADSKVNSEQLGALKDFLLQNRALDIKEKDVDKKPRGKAS